MEQFLSQVLRGVADRGDVKQADFRDFGRRFGRRDTRIQSQKSRRSDNAAAA